MKTIKTLTLVSILVVGMTTSVFASWWNPFTWFQKKVVSVQQVQQRPTTSIPMAQNTQLQNVGSTSKTVISTESDLQTYNNEKYGFNIQYVKDLIPLTPESSTSWYSRSENKGISVINFRNLKNRPERAQLRIGFSNDTVDVAECLTLPKSEMQTVTDKGLVVVNGISFKSFTVEDVATGHHWDEYWYKIIRNGSCWAIGTITQWNSHLSGDEAIQDKKELNQALVTLEQMVKSFKFITN